MKVGNYELALKTERISFMRGDYNEQVALLHGENYKIYMSNDGFERCDAIVTIDGKYIGTWRIIARQSVTIDRPAQDTGKFTFYKQDSDEFVAVLSDVAARDLGLVQVQFVPEKQVTREPYQSKSFESTTRGGIRGAGMMGNERSLGGTGLSGESSQKFGEAPDIELDYSRATTITLRLVPMEENTSSFPRKLEEIKPSVTKLSKLEFRQACQKEFELSQQNTRILLMRLLEQGVIDENNLTLDTIEIVRNHSFGGW